MAQLELTGERFTLYLASECPSSMLAMLTATRYRYVGQGTISSSAGIVHILFKTMPTEKERQLDAEHVLEMEPFDELCGESREQVLRRLEKQRDLIIDRVCEEHVQSIMTVRQMFKKAGFPDHKWLIPEIVFAPLKRDFLARHLYGKTTLTFASS